MLGQVWEVAAADHVACQSVKKRNSSEFGTVHYLNQDNQVPNFQTHTPHCMQEDQACSKLVV